jgi:hypothetical protein
MGRPPKTEEELTSELGNRGVVEGRGCHSGIFSELLDCVNLSC